MHRKPSKKEYEHWQLCRFRDSYAGFPAGELYPVERPDFLVKGARTYGVELTRLYQQPGGDGVSLQQQESLREEVTERAEGLYAGPASLALDVAVHFNDHPPLSKQRVGAVAEALAALVAANAPQLGDIATVEYDWVNRDQFPAEIVLVRVARFPQRDWCLWRPMNGGMVPDVTASLLQGAIDRKRADYTAHRAQCDEAWLVVVADGFAISSMFTFGDEARHHVYTSPFDRTIYFDNFRRRAVDLITEPPRLS
jgi:hypothetical protein